MMKCVERHSGADARQQEIVCKKEMNALRKQAFEDKLLYHHVNQRWF
jgi:hypothetical protein